MKHLILVLALVSIQAHAEYDDVPMYQSQESRAVPALEPVLLAPSYEPMRLQGSTMQNDQSWSQSVKSMDQEFHGRYP